MSKIFRLYKEGTTTYEDWNNSPAYPYNSTSRDTIEDPDGASARHEITSIPSPFARIDLIKTAFKEVCKPVGKTGVPNLNGKTIFHKMVSDTLDVAEIFFNIEKFKDKVEIIKWDASAMLAELDSSDSSGHRYLADALRKYMQSDAKTYNFGSIRSIYLLNYIEGPDELNIIGATSPATLFFSNANRLEYVNDIFFGEDKPFDEDYQPLYKRDFEFVKYFFALRKSIPDFAGLFPELDAYLSCTYREISGQEKKNILNNLPETYLDGLSSISVSDGSQSDIVEVIGYTLYRKTPQPVTSVSDFTIKTTKTTLLRPLVLPVSSGNKYSDLQYTTGKWGTSNAAPYLDNEGNLPERKLPYDGAQHPYLTISDFLENTILRVPHTLNTGNYFDGNISLRDSRMAYLLPVKPLLFEYFTAEEIRSNMPDGKPMLEMEALAGKSGIAVTLRIPVKGNGKITYVEYTRTYYNNSTADLENNKGGLVETDFTGFVMPQVKFLNDSDAVYNISCIQLPKGRTEFIFFKEDKKIQPKSITCRDKDLGLRKADNYLLDKTNFDFIQVRHQYGHSGVMLPLLREQKNIEHFEFAIDLGTSNTHVEFRKDGEKPEAFSFSANERPLCEMFIPEKNEYGASVDLVNETDIMEKDFIPGEIGRNDLRFPTRTVLSCARTIDWKDAIDPFTLVNIPFTYDKRAEYPYNNYRCNIKWGNGDDLRVMESYVRCLMLIIRNKVLLNNGDLQKTKIIWFYPISMAPKRLRRLKETWDDAYREYFGEGTTESMTESAAPIQYFFKRYSTATDLVNVDIGGGTTDIAFAKDKNISYVTSFRFASNVLFEDSFSELEDSNGIIDRYKGEIRKIFEEKKLSELATVFGSKNNGRPANMASFLFGLKDNTIAKSNGIDIKTLDFNRMLQEDENYRIVFIIFYTSIIYHIAHIVRNLGLDVPRHISFSGNGSKVIRIVTTDSKLLARYTKLVFEKILGRPYGKELELLGLERDSNPKESTCKGGIIGCEDEDNHDKTIVFKSDCSGLVTDADTYAAINDTYKQHTVEAVDDFFMFVLEDMNKAFNFDRNFGVTALSVQIAKETAGKDLMTYLEKGIIQRMEETEGTDRIEETFFYYPIKGVLQAISAEIYNELQQS
ncbi:MAG: cell division FtsA domain-containing protein [Bacteroidales bacterium]|nr:cell division FtsA domain-containing protein [Bacteroidales bacterium]MCM1146650.1 cell division FtsA domain-containing protein [Bacteroidales bacterium]MCM1206042.1 cell division FtsA domain-containing protein [Bacillota bacterium]MCM1511058.1 cell division FtsA domain-containing protein [Clostridium sp.]